MKQLFYSYTDMDDGNVRVEIKVDTQIWLDIECMESIKPQILVTLTPYQCHKIASMLTDAANNIGAEDEGEGQS